MKYQITELSIYVYFFAEYPVVIQEFLLDTHAIKDIWYHWRMQYNIR